jgi:hypothetical protein
MFRADATHRVSIPPTISGLDPGAVYYELIEPIANLPTWLIHVLPGASNAWRCGSAGSQVAMRCAGSSTPTVAPLWTACSELARLRLRGFDCGGRTRQSPNRGGSYPSAKQPESRLPHTRGAATSRFGCLMAGCSYLTGMRLNALAPGCDKSERAKWRGKAGGIRRRDSLPSDDNAAG